MTDPVILLLNYAPYIFPVVPHAQILILHLSRFHATHCFVAAGVLLFLPYVFYFLVLLAELNNLIIFLAASSLNLIYFWQIDFVIILLIASDFLHLLPFLPLEFLVQEWVLRSTGHLWELSYTPVVIKVSGLRDMLRLRREVLLRPWRWKKWCWVVLGFVGSKHILFFLQTGCETTCQKCFLNIRQLLIVTILPWNLIMATTLKILSLIYRRKQPLLIGFDILIQKPQTFPPPLLDMLESHF